MDEINLSIDYIKHQQNNKQYWQVNDNCILALEKKKGCSKLQYTQSIENPNLPDSHFLKFNLTI